MPVAVGVVSQAEQEGLTLLGEGAASRPAGGELALGRGEQCLDHTKPTRRCGPGVRHTGGFGEHCGKKV